MEKNERRAITCFSIAVVGLLLLASVQGCDLQEMISVDVPASIREISGIPADERVSLADAPRVFEAFQARVESDTAAFNHALADAQDRYSIISSILDLGIAQLETSAGSIPGGTILVAALSGLGGLFLRQPGTRRRELRIRRDGFEAGASSRDSA